MTSPRKKKKQTDKLVNWLHNLRAIFRLFLPIFWGRPFPIVCLFFPISGRRPEPYSVAGQRGLGCRGHLGPSGKRVRKRSRRRVDIDKFSTVLTLLSIPFGAFWASGPRGQGTHFDLFSTLGPKSPNHHCSRSRESQSSITQYLFEILRWSTPGVRFEPLFGI